MPSPRLVSTVATRIGRPVVLGCGSASVWVPGVSPGRPLADSQLFCPGRWVTVATGPGAGRAVLRLENGILVRDTALRLALYGRGTLTNLPPTNQYADLSPICPDLTDGPCANPLWRVA